MSTAMTSTYKVDQIFAFLQDQALPQRILDKNGGPSGLTEALTELDEAETWYAGWHDLEAWEILVLYITTVRPQLDDGQRNCSSTINDIFRQAYLQNRRIEAADWCKRQRVKLNFRASKKDQMPIGIANGQLPLVFLNVTHTSVRLCCCGDCVVSY